MYKIDERTITEILGIIMKDELANEIHISEVIKCVTKDGKNNKIIVERSK